MLRLTSDQDLVEALERDAPGADLDTTERAMVDFALKLTRLETRMNQEDVVRLREAGFDDESILGIVQVVAYFAFANRLADGLGVPLERSSADGVG